jgi:small subunit ribosomal protein S1
MDLTYLDHPEGLIGTHQKFKVTQFEEEGKNIVLSRRAVLQAEKEALALNTRNRLKVDEVFKGQITRLTPFGAFVDLGGLEGLVHISEITRGQVADPSDLLTLGQEVDVKVLEIKTDEKGQERISLSMKVLEPDPWETELEFNEGDILIGKVRHLAQFGAFIEIAPGLEGLVHISEISYKRIRHPKELLQEGQQVEVKVLEINQDQRRISLSIKEVPSSSPEVAIPDQEVIRIGNLLRRRKKVEAKEEYSSKFQDNLITPLNENLEEIVPVVPSAPRVPQVGLVVKGVIQSIKPYGFFVDLPELGLHQRGLLHNSQTSDPGKIQKQKSFKEGNEIEVEIIKIDDQGRISLSQSSILESQDKAELLRYRERVQDTGKLGTMADLFKKKK